MEAQTRGVVEITDVDPLDERRVAVVRQRLARNVLGPFEMRAVERGEQLDAR